MIFQKTITDKKGQFLLYDMLLAFIILLVVLISTTYLLESNTMDKNQKDYTEGRYLLDLLEDEDLLTKLSTALDDNDYMKTNQTVEKIDDILSTSCRYNYSLTDETINRTLIDHSPTTYKDVYSYQIMLNNHEFRLRFYQ